MDKLAATVFALLGMIAISVLLSLLIIKAGWTLFMVPVFHIPDLSWVEALGFALLASAFKTNSMRTK
jgi:hypothetical protein